MHISYSCPVYNFNKAGNIVGRNFTVKKDQEGGCVSQALKRDYVTLKQDKKIFCLKSLKEKGAAQKVMLLLM